MTRRASASTAQPSRHRCEATITSDPTVSPSVTAASAYGHSRVTANRVPSSSSRTSIAGRPVSRSGTEPSRRTSWASPPPPSTNRLRRLCCSSTTRRSTPTSAGTVTPGGRATMRWTLKYGSCSPYHRIGFQIARCPQVSGPVPPSAAAKSIAISRTIASLRTQLIRSGLQDTDYAQWMSPDIPAYDPVPPIAPESAPRIDQLVWARAAERPAAVAVRDGDTVLSYAELTARADRLAARLPAGGVVGLRVPRSADFLVGLLAVLRAGAACLPLSPTDPPARIDAILDTVAPTALITPGLLVEASGAADERGTDLAFVMPTSGSTGRPKAVRITHANYTSQLPWIRHNFGLGADDVTLFRAPVSFVSMLRQVVWPLTAGAELVVVPPGGEVDVAGMARLIDAHRVSWLTFISPALAHFLGHARLAGGSVRNVVSGGDRMPSGTAQAFFGAFPARLHHTYGLTEAIVVSCALLTGPDADERSMGPLLPGGSAVILGDDGSPAPVGTVGELHVGGVALTPGTSAGTGPGS